MTTRFKKVARGGMAPLATPMGKYRSFHK